MHESNRDQLSYSSPLYCTGIPRNSRLIRRKRPSRISKYREFRNLYNLGKEALNFVVFGHFLDKMVKLFEPFCKLSKQNQ